MASFEDQVSAWTTKTEKKLETAFRKIALDVFSEVILKSPVKSGRFRGNWQVSVGTAKSGAVTIDDKTGTATIGKVYAETLGLKAGQTIYLVNNLPYARKLEYGHSQQAPNGFVRITAQRWKPIVDAVSRELSKG